jgi:hypothetical protein
VLLHIKLRSEDVPDHTLLVYDVGKFERTSVLDSKILYHGLLSRLEQRPREGLGQLVCQALSFAGSINLQRSGLVPDSGTPLMQSSIRKLSLS